MSVPLANHALSTVGLTPRVKKLTLRVKQADPPPSHPLYSAALTPPGLSA